MDDESSIRRVEAERLEKIFYHTAIRKVANDATIRLNTKVFETKQEYIGSRITIKYKPDLSEVYIFDDDSYIKISEVKKVDQFKNKKESDHCFQRRMTNERF